MNRWGVLLGLMMVPACNSGAAPGRTEPAFAAIGVDERIEIVGTEPFWAITAKDGELTYKTPQQPEGDTIPVRRFAGRGGVSYSGTLDGQPLDVTVTQGACNDGMADARYPFTATLRIGTAQHPGCAWTDAHAVQRGAQG